MNKLIDFLFGAKITIFDKYTSFFNVVFFSVIAPLFVVFIHFYSNDASLLSSSFWKNSGWVTCLISVSGSLIVLLSLLYNIRLLKIALILSILIDGGLTLFVVLTSFSKVAVIMLSFFTLISFFLVQEVSWQVNTYSDGISSVQWPLNMKCYVQECGQVKIIQISRDFIQCSVEVLDDIKKFAAKKNLKCQVGVGSRELFFEVRLESIANNGNLVGFRVINPVSGDWLPFYEVMETMGVV